MIIYRTNYKTLIWDGLKLHWWLAMLEKGMKTFRLEIAWEVIGECTILISSRGLSSACRSRPKKLFHHNEWDNFISFYLIVFSGAFHFFYPC
jgi:hypothetical protein